MQNVTDYTTFTSDELYEEYNNLGRRVMYYAAAEGNWSSETADRIACEADYYAAQNELKKRGLQI